MSLNSIGKKERGACKSSFMDCNLKRDTLVNPARLLLAMREAEIKFPDVTGNSLKVSGEHLVSNWDRIQKAFSEN